jgi:hypothetical protein
MKLGGILALSAALVLTGCGLQEQPPVSEKVQKAYEAGSTLAPVATAKPSGLDIAVKTEEKLDGQSVSLLASPAPNGTLVIAAHGHGGNVTEWSKGEQQKPMLSALIDAGYAIATSDANGDAWGNPSPRTRHSMTGPRPRVTSRGLS